MKYEIIASGSKGNAVIIDDMLFDIGVPIAKLRQHLYKTKYIFITHRHSDHFSLKTAQTIEKEFPRIQWIANWDVASKFSVKHIVGDSTTLKFKDRTIQSFACVHDVPTHGYVIEKKDLAVIYATDTSSLEHAPKMKYDLLFLESNHDENKIKQIMFNARKLYGYDAYGSALRHLSTQNSKAFYYMHRKSKDSEWVQLHKSHRFY